MSETVNYLKIQAAKLKCLVMGHAWSAQEFKGKHYQFTYNQCTRCDKGRR